MNSLALQGLDAPLGIGEVRVSGVHQYIPPVKVRGQLSDKIIHRLPRFHHEDHPAGTGEGRHESLDGFGARNGLIPGPSFQELAGLFCRAVIHGHRKPVVGHVAHQVLPHHGQPDQSDVVLFHSCPEMSSRNLTAIETRLKVLPILAVRASRSDRGPVSALLLRRFAALFAARLHR